MSTAKEAYHHARDVVKGRWKEGEPLLAQDAVYAYAYARDVLKAPFPLGEPIIAKDGTKSVCYAIEVLKAPFPMGEAAISRESKERQRQYEIEFGEALKKRSRNMIFEIDMDS